MADTADNPVGQIVSDAMQQAWEQILNKLSQVSAISEPTALLGEVQVAPADVQDFLADVALAKMAISFEPIAPRRQALGMTAGIVGAGGGNRDEPTSNLHYGFECRW